jgi:hypothetical protein
MSPDRKTRLILLFGQNTDHPFFPAKVLTAGARSGGQEPALGQRSEGQPSGQGRQRFPLTASTMAALRALRAMLFMVAIFESSMLLSDSAHTPASVAGHTSSERYIQQSLRGFCHGGRPSASGWRNSGYARCCKSKAAANCECDHRTARHVGHADHAKDLG